MATTSTMDELTYISQLLQHKLKTVENFSKTIAVDPTVQQLSSKYNSSHNSFNELDVIALRERIDQTIQSTDFIHSVSLYATDKSLITTTDIAMTPPSIKNMDIPSEFWILREKIDPYDPDKTITVLSFIKGYYDYEEGAPLGYIEITIPESSISEIFKSQVDSTYSQLFMMNPYGILQSTDQSYQLYQLYPYHGSMDLSQDAGYTLDSLKIIFYKRIPTLDWIIVHEIHMTFFLQPIYTLVLVTLLITLCGIVLIIFMSSRIAKSITRPLNRLIRHIQGIKKGQWQPISPIAEDHDTGFLMTEFNAMILAQTELKNTLILEQEMKQKLSLDLLQQQVNPHFLYNALDNVCALAEINDLSTLNSIIMNLSNFYRETLSQGSFIITISKELGIIEAYLQIMYIRTHHSFEYTVECGDNLKNLPCLKLLLQPLVENSIYHGIKEYDDTGFIYIQVESNSDYLYFIVKDNGVGLKRSKEMSKKHKGGFGLINLRKRIELYYGSRSSLELTSNDWGGCTALIKIDREVMNLENHTHYC